MKRETSIDELQGLLEAIKCSDVVERRAQLISELGDLDLAGESVVACLLESLTVSTLLLVGVFNLAYSSVNKEKVDSDWILWEDFTCLDASQCMLNKTILDVAAKYTESDISRCLGPFLVLGTKASIWCAKHLKMTLMSTEDSQEEEHSSLFFQLLLELLSYSAAIFSALAKYPISSVKELMLTVAKFILEQLNLIKDSVMEIKRIHSHGSQLLKVAQVVLDAVIRLCRVYFNGVKCDLFVAKTEEERNSCEENDIADHVINTTRCTVEKLCELGILAAKGGGNLVSVLNLSWKGVVTLLQLGKGALAVKVNIADIIFTLLSLANKSLRFAAETWSYLLKEKVSVAEAKRIFLPVKFYLINAVRIISHYPSQAFSVYKDITLCIVMISTFRISLSKEELLKSASDALAELLEPTSFHLLNSLLNSAQVKHEEKFQILDWLFSDGSDLNLVLEDSCTNQETYSMEAIFSVTVNSMHGAKVLLIGRLALFLNLLKSAPELEDDVRLGIARKLGWFFDILVDEYVYSSILVLQVPVLYASGQNQELAYQPMLSSILHALKTFMVVVSSTLAWREILSFVVENFLHPHFLCSEIVVELLCFTVRHAEIDLVIDIIDKLCSLLRSVASSESVFVPGSGLRKIARSICMLLSYCSQSTVDRVYNSMVDGNTSKLSSIMYFALLMEGFPLNLLPDKTKSAAKQRIVTEYFCFLESFEDKSSGVCGSGVFGAPVFALSAALQSLELSRSDTDTKTLNLLIAIIRKYKDSVDCPVKDYYRNLLSETLRTISSMKHLYASDDMEAVILELQNLFISGPASSDTELYQCKPNLACFMAGLGHIEFAESDNSVKSSSVWELYHMLLRERHWALVHLAITAFGYFAERTTCNELWRFVPPDAALSFDLESGNEADEERFMSELKVFLEKEMASLGTTDLSDQAGLLVKEGLLLKEMIQKVSKIEPEAMICNVMETDDEQQANKRRKLPDGISKGVELLQSGLKVICDDISQLQQNHFDSTELHDNFLTHFSCLEDVITHLVSLTGSG
ncbi:hypothetical protein RJ639_017419 [Escallonia herrerae]|uniref:Uncharacterized protein n=1 Tax=Escallonia herrerae TaxID=1293975 RepID=A0AA88VDF4_9ASTE|nr:hypothetical protein RJ639_017419 [Escallonia herrerae]